MIYYVKVTATVFRNNVFLHIFILIAWHIAKFFHIQSNNLKEKIIELPNIYEYKEKYKYVHDAL